MPTIETPRGKIAYADHRKSDSDKTPVLFIHGAGDDHLVWPPELRRLPEANAIFPDLPGHGKSGEAGRDTVSDYAADMIALLDALELESVIVAGHSMGGAIAQTIALDYPARVKGLILIGTGAQLAVNEAILTGIQSDREATIRTMAKWMWAKDVPDAMREMSVERMMAAKPAVIHGDYLACSRFDVRDRISEISTPTLVIGGTADKMTPHKLSAFLAETIPNAELVTIEGGGHMMMLEQPQAVAEAVRAWLLAR